MGELIVETKRQVHRTRVGTKQIEENNDCEMRECLARLEVWQVENLMAPHGMDKFAQDMRPQTTD